MGAKASDAQQGGNNGGTTGDGQGGFCAPDEELVESFSDTVDQTTEQFEITGPEWRVVVEGTATTSTSGDVTVDALDEDGFFEGGASVFVDPDFLLTTRDSSSVLDGPGSFRLEIDANGASYEISVCQTPGQGGGTNGDTNGDGVIDDTIPDKDLPNTGGSPVVWAGIVALLALYVGLFTWRIKNRGW